MLLLALGCLLPACDPAADPPPAARVWPPAVQQILNEMAELGAQESDGHSYAYTLLPSCRLQVTLQIRRQPVQRVLLPLHGSSFERFDFAPGLGAAVRAISSPELPNLFVADTTVTADRMLGRLRVLAARCPD